MRGDMSANSWIVRRSSRRWIDNSVSGTASVMNPGLLPVLWIDALPSAQAASTRARTSASMLGGMVEHPARGHDVDPGRQELADHVDVARPGHVEHAVGMRGDDRLELIGGGDAHRGQSGDISPASWPTLSAE